jgi:hypothetical protein
MRRRQAMGLFFRARPTSVSIDALKPVVREALAEQGQSSEEKVTELARSAAAAATGTEEAVPRPMAFFGAIAILVILLVAWIFVAMQVDANPDDAQAQLEIIANGLGAAFTTVLGLIGGLVAGESKAT